MDIRKLQRAIVDGLEDVKAHDIVVLNTEHLSPLFERVIIASGTSNRQTRALASSVRDAVKQRGMPVLATEGADNGEWIVVDCGAAVAHIMQPAIREYYHLEEIWGGKPVKMKMDGEARGLPKAAPVDDDEAPARKAGASKGPARTAAKGPAKKPGKKPAKTLGAASRAALSTAPAAAKKPAAKAATPKRAAATASGAKAAAAQRAAPAKPRVTRTEGVKVAPKTVLVHTASRNTRSAKAGAKSPTKSPTKAPARAPTRAPAKTAANAPAKRPRRT